MKKLMVIVVILFMSMTTRGYYPRPLEDTPPEEAERGVIALEFRGVGSERRPYLVGTTEPFRKFRVQYSTDLVEWITLNGQVSSPPNGHLQVLILMEEYPEKCFFR